MQSVVVFGRCHFVTDKMKAMELLRSLAAKYYPDEQTVDEEIQKSGKAAQVFEVEIEHLSGKEVQER